MKYKFTSVIGKASIAPIALILIWEVGTRVGYVPTSIISPPLSAIKTLGALILDGTLLNHLLISSKRLFGGFIMGSFIGIAMGIVVAYKQEIAKYAEPLLLILIPVPPLAWIPVLIILFGTDDGMKISLISVGSFATMFLSTSLVVRSIDKRYIDACKQYEKNDFEIVWKVIIPFCTDTIFSSLRVAMALSWTLLMASEMIKSSSGVGWFINDSRNFSRSSDLVAGIIFVGIMGKIVNRQQKVDICD